MTDAMWESLSNQAVAAGGVVYFLALLSHLVEWTALRRLPAARPGERPAVSVGTPAGPVAAPPPGIPGPPGGPGPDAARPEMGAGETGRRAALAGRLGLLLTVIATGVHLLALLGRGLAADPDRVPWGNMYEFTLSGTFVVSLLYLVLYRRLGLAWMAPWVVGFVLTMLMAAVIWLYAPVAPLTEALYSPWLVIHVVSAVVATAAFTLGGIVSGFYLVADRARSAGRTDGYAARLPAPEALDRVSYRLHAFGFPVWTFAVLITGPIWAHQAWSSYWNWDPKEVWAFITWVVYAAYLHARSTAGWRGRYAAYIALAGLATLWFNFIGINFFSTTSQHSYAAPAAVVAEVGAGEGRAGPEAGRSPAPGRALA